MAAIARMDQEQRVTEVNRLKLVEILEANRAKHIKDYEEAMAGYKDALLQNIDKAFGQARAELELNYERAKKKAIQLTAEDILKQRDSNTLVDSVVVELRVPRSFVKEYDAAIDIAKWDVNETLKLTYAEFTCFVRDQWDWKSGFDLVTSMYNGFKK